jgi:hypothetical protein
MIRQERIRLACMTKGSTSALFASLIGTPKDPRPMAATIAAIHPHHSVQPSNTDVRIFSQSFRVNVFEHLDVEKFVM